MRQPPKSVGPVPNREQLHDSALRHLARFATTEAGLVRVLDRRIARWARAAALESPQPDGDEVAARLNARAVAKACVAAGLVDDAVFAAARAARLTRAGRSRRAIAAHLASKGITTDILQAALPDTEHEMTSALTFARRRRIGPFRETRDDVTRNRDLGALARAGFSRDIAEEALRMSSEQAASVILSSRRG